MAFFWFVVITFLTVTLIIVPLHVSKLFLLLSPLDALLLLRDHPCLATICRGIAATPARMRHRVLPPPRGLGRSDRRAVPAGPAAGAAAAVHHLAGDRRGVEDLIDRVLHVLPHLPQHDRGRALHRSAAPARRAVARRR